MVSTNAAKKGDLAVYASTSPTTRGDLGPRARDAVLYNLGVVTEVDEQGRAKGIRCTNTGRKAAPFCTTDKVWVMSPDRVDVQAALAGSANRSFGSLEKVRSFLRPLLRSVPVHDRPCAAQGLISYRYAGNFGWIMIGAKNTAHALSEAGRSLSSGAVGLSKLQIWNGTSYVPAS